MFVGSMKHVIKLGRSKYSMILNDNNNNNNNQNNQNYQKLNYNKLLLSALSSNYINSNYSKDSNNSNNSNNEKNNIIKLWELLKGDLYLLHTISTCYPTEQRQNPGKLLYNTTNKLATLNSNSGSGKSNKNNNVSVTNNNGNRYLKQSDYQLVIMRYVYRNNLLDYIKLSYRYIATLHVSYVK